MNLRAIKPQKLNICHTCSVVRETTLQTIPGKFMSIGRGKNNVTSESGVGDLGHNVLVGLGKDDLRRNKRTTVD